MRNTAALSPEHALDLFAHEPLSLRRTVAFATYLVTQTRVSPLLLLPDFAALVSASAAAAAGHLRPCSPHIRGGALRLLQVRLAECTGRGIWSDSLEVSCICKFCFLVCVEAISFLVKLAHNGCMRFLLQA